MSSPERPIATTRSACGTGSGSQKSELTKLKTVLFTPMPKATQSMAVSV